MILIHVPMSLPKMMVFEAIAFNSSFLEKSSNLEAFRYNVVSISKSAFNGTSGAFEAYAA